MLTNGLAMGAVTASERIAVRRMVAGYWQRRAIQLKPWLFGLAGFLITSAGLLYDRDRTAGADFSAVALHIRGAGAS